MNTLPPELVDDIIEHTYYDVNAVVQRDILITCARLCRTWSAPSQRMLFRRVRLDKSTNVVQFLAATDPGTDRGRTLGGYVRVLAMDISVGVGDRLLDNVATIDGMMFTMVLSHIPRLYQLELRVFVHRFTDEVLDGLRRLASPPHSRDENTPDRAVGSLRIRALSLLQCHIQSPVLYQLLSVWPSIEFLSIGVELGAPPPKWHPEFHLYQVTFMRTPRLPILSWLLSSSMQSLRIATFRDVPGRDTDQIFAELGPRLRSLRLNNYNQRVEAVIGHCPNLEELVLVQLSRLHKLNKLPRDLEHLSCRSLPAEPQWLDLVIEAVPSLPKLKVLTCECRAREDPDFTALEALCGGRGIELYLDDMPFWIPDDPVYVNRYPKRKSVGNFALMV